MKYFIDFTSDAIKDMEFWKRSGQKKTVQKIYDLLQELQEHPFTGTGKPETLKGNYHNKWSRRITGGDRLIYSVHDDVVVVQVISMKGHYDDK